MDPIKSETMIQVRGARVHNLRDVDVDIPRDSLVVLTGVSGSGKSTLAFDTLYAEGRRRYIEGLSSYARQFLDQLERPDVDAIEGLPPTVAIDQHSGSANPRSTVATITEINDYLRLLYARLGMPHCPRCGVAIQRQSPEQVVSGVLALPEGTKVILLAPLVRGKKGEHREAFDSIRRAGLIRARVDGELVEIQENPRLAKTKIHDVEAVVDRLVVRDGIRPRLAESVDTALKMGDGTIVLSMQEGAKWVDRRLSIHYACPQCGLSIEEVEPRTFSFNSPHGACARCKGLGRLLEFDPDLILPDPSQSLDSGVVAAWSILRPKTRKQVEDGLATDSFLKRFGLSRSTPLSDWPPPARHTFLHGDRQFGGLIPSLIELHERGSAKEREAWDVFRIARKCGDCDGARLRPEARSVTLGKIAIHQLSGMSIVRARQFLADWVPPVESEAVALPLLSEILPRLDFLLKVRLGYLSLDRCADTLSGGELQRVRLASQIGSGLVGVCYLLDEPTAGLHPSDTQNLLETLDELRQRGNSLVVVEHDEATIRSADWLIDLGPGAGTEGGRIVAAGIPADIIRDSDTETARYLRGELSSPISKSDRLLTSPGNIEIRGAAENNLKAIDVAIPLGALTCVSGVSGSGKSTLVHEILARSCRHLLLGHGPKPGTHGSISGLDRIDKLIEVDQSPIGKGPRSTPAIYVGVFDEIRRVFAAMKEAKIRGYGLSRFSFNVKAGRCETCLGQGVRRVEMGFLPEIHVRCESCEGLRYNRSTLEVRFKGKSIGEVLLMRVDAALSLFENVPRVKRGLLSLQEAGLGYVTLGQASNTLSGGESQRVKLAAELGRESTGRTLYILDEPTTGLHFSDVARLVTLLHRLADMGNTVVVIEHHLDLIRVADWVIDLGPEGGERGGEVLGMGPPAAIKAASLSLTGQWL